MNDMTPIALNVIRRVPLANIDRSDRLRPIDQAKVQLIADSILAYRAAGNEGTPAPVTVRPTGVDQFRLIVGGHRTAAHELLGDIEIDVIVRAMGDLQARLMEIDENLCRNELNALDRSAFLAERHRIWEEMYPDKAGRKGSMKARWHSAKDASDTTRTVRVVSEASDPTDTVSVGSSQSEKFSFAEDAQEKIGLSASTIRRDVQMYRLLASTPDILARVRGTDLEDNPGQLKALARVPAAERAGVLDLMFREEAPVKNVSSAIALMQGHREPSASPDEHSFAALVKDWTRASKKVRNRFLDHLHSSGALDAYTTGNED